MIALLLHVAMPSLLPVASKVEKHADKDHFSVQSSNMCLDFFDGLVHLDLLELYHTLKS